MANEELCWVSMLHTTSMHVGSIILAHLRLQHVFQNRPEHG